MNRAYHGNTLPSNTAHRLVTAHSLRTVDHRVVLLDKLRRGTVGSALLRVSEGLGGAPVPRDEEEEKEEEGVSKWQL